MIMSRNKPGFRPTRTTTLPRLKSFGYAVGWTSRQDTGSAGRRLCGDSNNPSGSGSSCYEVSSPLYLSWQEGVTSINNAQREEETFPHQTYPNLYEYFFIWCGIFWFFCCFIFTESCSCSDFYFVFLGIVMILLKLDLNVHFLGCIFVLTDLRALCPCLSHALFISFLAPSG